MATEKPESSPLLQPGIHTVSSEELHQLCVDRFPNSLSRRRLWSNFRFFLTRLTKSGLSGEIWVDGSFLTEKVNPNDIDLVFRADGDECDNATVEQNELLNWLESTEPHDVFDLHTFVFFEYPNGPEPLKQAGERARRYWERWWGTSRKNVPKGFAVIRMGRS